MRGLTSGFSEPAGPASAPAFARVGGGKTDRDGPVSRIPSDR